MKKGGKDFRNSSYQDLIKRNITKPKKLEKIKKKVKMTLSILAAGLGYSNASLFCDFNDFPLYNESTYYDYLHKLEPILEDIADQICIEKLNEALQKNELFVAFDGGWAHRRNANQFIGTLIDLMTGFIISFQIIHHGAESSKRVTPTQKHSTTMEKDALKIILENINISNIETVKFIHDCDINADNIVSKLWPSSTIKYDPNHYTKTQNSIIDAFCMQDEKLKKLSENIKNYYSSLMHDRESDLETKINKWKGIIEHYATKENWNIENNPECIQTLTDLVDELSATFSKIDPKLTSNPCESFNHSRSLMASKDIAWRLSWRLRAFLTIIRWNDDNWVQTICQQFFIFDANDSIATKKKKIRQTKRLLEKTEPFKKCRSEYRKNYKNRYVAKKNEKNAHKYKTDTKLRTKKVKRNKEKVFSPLQRSIINIIYSLSTEDHIYVSFIKILKNFDKYHDTNKYRDPQRIIRAQLTKLVNSNIIVHKTNCYALINTEKTMLKLKKQAIS